MVLTLVVNSVFVLCALCKDILAVGYLDSGNQKPGLICCWSLKNLTVYF